MARTILTKAQQVAFLEKNWQAQTLTHKWSTRGHGSSRIVDGRGDVVAKASGCGYDRRGKALGDAVMALFGAEVYKLAKRECRGRRRTYKQAPKFYGLFFNSVDDRAWIDGACGDDCVKRILNKIGFSLEWVGESDHGRTGDEFYRIVPLTAHDRKYNI